MHEIRQAFSVRYDYPVRFVRDAFGAGDEALRTCLEEAGPGRHRILMVCDAGLLAADQGLPERLRSFADRHRQRIQWVAPPLALPGGEAAKADEQGVDRVLEAVERHGLCRHSLILALGGGALLDAVGYAAAVAHRGVRLLRMPSTVLAQNDAGIGVKNAVNRFGRKNFVGTFAPPLAVVNDLDLLETLPARERRAGLAEAVKVALIRDAAFFEGLHRDRHRLARFEREAEEAMILRCAALHLDHIRTGGDPFEMGSARPLDFGHWVAHRLEEISGGALRHGEAVAIGIAVDSLYSHAVGRLDELSLRRILATLEDLGFALSHPSLRWLEVEPALEAFREHLGGRLCITLLEGIGRGVEVDRIDTVRMTEAIARLCARPAAPGSPALAGPDRSAPGHSGGREAEEGETG